MKPEKNKTFLQRLIDAGVEAANYEDPTYIRQAERHLRNGDVEAANTAVKAGLAGAVAGAALAAPIIASTPAAAMTAPQFFAYTQAQSLPWARRFVWPLVKSTIGGEAVNTASEALTGKSFGQNVYGTISQILPESMQKNPYIQTVGPIVGDFLNPGYTAGAKSKMLDKIGDTLGETMYFYEKLPHRLREVILRIGDQAHSPKAVITQVASKNAAKYLLIPGMDEFAYKLPFKYSGQHQVLPDVYKITTKDVPLRTALSEPVTPGMLAHKGDMIDFGLRKTNYLRALSVDGKSYMDFYPSDIPVTKKFDDYIKTNYPDRKIRYIDFGNVNKGGTKSIRKHQYDIDFPPTGKPYTLEGSGGELPTVMYTDPVTKNKFYLTDPGGHLYTIDWDGGNNLNGVYTGYDINKYNMSDYMKKHSTIPEWATWKEKFKSSIVSPLKRFGLKFLDAGFDPVVTRWTEPINMESLNKGVLDSSAEWLK